MRIVGGDESANAKLRATDSDDDFIFHDERLQRDGVSKFVVSDRDVPERFAVFCIDGDEMRVECAHEQGVAQDRDAAVVGAAADLLAAGIPVLVDPENPSGFRVERHDIVGPLREVHDSVHHNGRRLPRARDLVLQNPLQLEILYVGRIDLLQQAVALARIAAGIAQPVLRFVARPQKAIERYLRVDAIGDERKQCQQQEA